MPSLGRSGKLFSETRDFSLSLKAQFGQVYSGLLGKKSSGRGNRMCKSSDAFLLP